MIPLYRKGLVAKVLGRLPFGHRSAAPSGLSRQGASQAEPAATIASASADLRALYGYEPAPIRPKGWHWHAVAEIAFVVAFLFFIIFGLPGLFAGV
jgi:hypothetical protein